MNKVLHKSEKFHDFYAIFVDRRTNELYRQYIHSRQWHFQYGVLVLDAEFDPDLSCIVIPNGLNHQCFENELFKFKSSNKSNAIKESQFWGQHGIGYEGKFWSIY